jgi:prepilin-type N-terminal cleavage/methylation domain-containing protein
MSKRRGFTLTEIVVVIALTSLVLAMVGGCLYFVSTYSGTLISKSEELTKVQTIETYLRGQFETKGADLINSLDGKNISIDRVIKLDEDSNLLFDKNVIVKNTGLKQILIYKEDTSDQSNAFLKCKLVFQSDNDYTFILGIVQK